MHTNESSPGSEERPIWIDITTLAFWGRPAVGIVRVEQQLCNWLLAQNKANVGFCFYDRARNQFYELNRESVIRHLERIRTSAQSVSDSGIRMNLEQRLRKRALDFLAKIPPRPRSVILRKLLYIKPLLLRLIGRARKIYLTVKQPRRPSGAFGDSRQPLDLPSGSTYVSLGLDWEYKDMAQLYQLKKAKKIKFVLCCYDIIPILFPHLCVGDVSRKFAHYFADLAWGADLVLCISESSRRDLCKLLEELRVPLPEMAVIRLGSDVLQAEDATAPISDVVARVLERPCLLFVSTIERRKNHEILYRSYTRLIEEGLDLPDLVFVGMPGWGTQELLSDIHLDTRVQGRIHILNHVSDAELACLYRHASFTVFPSLYEGWGLPVAESLAHGKFCLCSNTSSLPEVGDNWVDCLDPWNLPGWVDRLRYYVTHPEEVAKRNAGIVAGYHPPLWSETSADIYSQALRLSKQRE